MLTVKSFLNMSTIVDSTQMCTLKETVYSDTVNRRPGGLELPQTSIGS